MEKEEEMGGGDGRRAPGERGRDEEEERNGESVSGSCNPPLLTVDAPFHTPTFKSFLFFIRAILFIGPPAGHTPNLVPRSPHSMASSTVPYPVYAPTPVSFVYLSTVDLEPVSADGV